MINFWPALDISKTGQKFFLPFSTFKKKISGRAEAKLATKKRDPVLSSNNFIRQYFQSFSSDPIMNHDSAVQMNGDANSENES